MVSKRIRVWNQIKREANLKGVTRFTTLIGKTNEQLDSELERIQSLPTQDKPIRRKTKIPKKIDVFKENKLKAIQNTNIILKAKFSDDVNTHLKEKSRIQRDLDSFNLYLPKKESQPQQFRVKSKKVFSGFTRNVIESDTSNSIKDIFKIAENLNNSRINQKKQIGAITLLFTDQNKTKIIGRTVPISKLGNFKTFESYISRNILSENAFGSDSVNISELKPVLNQFDFNTIDIVALGGDINFTVYQTAHLPNSDDCCNKCLSECGFPTEDKIDQLDTLIKYIKENNLPISIISNSIAYTPEFYIDQYKIIESTNFICKKLRSKVNQFHYLSSDYLEPDYIFRCDNQKHILLYDYQSEHVDYCWLKNGCLISTIYVNYQKGFISSYPRWNDKKKVMKSTQFHFNHSKVIKELQRPSKVFNGIIESEYIFFDFETTIDWDEESRMKPYSLAILKLSHTELESLEKMDFEMNQVGVDDLIIKNSHCWVGYNCISEFNDYLSSTPENIRYTLIGYNNANFDNLILLEWYLKFNPDVISSVCFMNNSVLSFKIFGCNDIFDIHKHLFGSLNDACTNFKVNCCPKLSLNHTKMQDLYDEDREKFIKDRMVDADMIKYNIYDVASTAVIFKRYQDALLNIPNDIIISRANNLTDYKTIGSFIYGAIQDYWIDIGYSPPALYSQDPDVGDKLFTFYNDMLKYKAAGRCELFNGTTIVNEEVAAIDVCSQYPFHMICKDNLYPDGDVVISSYDGFCKLTAANSSDKLIGWFYVNIDQSNLWNNNKPNLYPLKKEFENCWDTREILKEYFISTIDINKLIEYGCIVDFCDRDGLYFTKTIESTKLFGILGCIMQAKNQQDIHKKNNSNLYNKSLRETCKLLLNAPSGKVIERLHCSKIELLQNVSDFNSLFKKSVNNKIKDLRVSNVIGGRAIIQYEVDPQSIIKRHRPIYIGLLIYAYSRNYLYDKIIDKVPKEDIYYCDTDCIHMKKTAFSKWCKDEGNKLIDHNPLIYEYDERYKDHKLYEDDSKIFGSFENELKDLGKNNYAFYMSKKMYSIGSRNDTFKVLKSRFKGVHKNDLFIEDDNPICKLDKNRLKIDRTQKEIYNYIKTRDNCLENHLVHKKFLDQLCRTKQAYILTSSFKKSIRNLKHDVNLDDKKRFNNNCNTIRMSYSLKLIKI